MNFTLCLQKFINKSPELQKRADDVIKGVMFDIHKGITEAYREYESSGLKDEVRAWVIREFFLTDDIIYANCVRNGIASLYEQESL